MKHFAIFTARHAVSTAPRLGAVSMVEAEASRRNGTAVDTAIAILKQRFGERLATGDQTRQQHGHTTTWLANQPPDAVVFPHDTSEVSAIVSICAEHRVPVIPFGTGTSLEGHLNAPQGGVSVDMSAMDAILAVYPQDLNCVVQPGVTRKALNENLRDSGLFFPIDPGADASLGGMAATRASGTNAVRYGTMRELVISVEAVLGDGTVIRTGHRAKKSAAGYDLTRLLVGSEGTLGLITELTLKLSGIPEAISAGVCGFPTVEAACNATIATIQYGLPVARIELLDALQMKACNAHSNLDYAEVPTLFLEFHGSDAGVREQSTAFGEIAAEFGGSEFRWATREEDRHRLWQARHDAYWSAFMLRPGSRLFSTDVCVPISRLAECVTATQDDIAELGLVAPIVGHVGDGNFHVSVMIDTSDADDVARGETFIGRLNNRAIEMDGTCTGEHGIGQGKMKYLELELGNAVDVMRTIKAALDPLDILNPGKIMMPEGAAGRGEAS